MSAGARSYRSRNRQHPCDDCRRQKVRCVLDGQPPCVRCARMNAPCAFSRRQQQPYTASLADPSRTPCQTQTPSAVLSRAEQSDPPQLPSASLQRPPSVTNNTSASVVGQSPPLAESSPSPSPVFHAFTKRPDTNKSRGLDDIERDQNYQLIGASSCFDPWLLQHCKFDEQGSCGLMNVGIRTVTGTQLPLRRYPVQFMSGKDNRSHSTSSGGAGASCKLLELIPWEVGVRLLRIFMIHVFPLVPVLSRTALGLGSSWDQLNTQALSRVPVHVLAAIYASALPFAWDDDELSHWETFEAPRDTELWQLCYESLVLELHTPRLDVIQSALLFLHRPPAGVLVENSSSDWTLMGMTVAAAHTLGLHLDCSHFNLPPPDVRLRRRLWWTLFIEDKMRSLLHGRPPLIHEKDWDVTRPEAKDFAYGTEIVSCSSEADIEFSQPFRDMVELAIIAEAVREKLYAVKNCQDLPSVCVGSVEAVHPLFEQLHAWRKRLPMPLDHHCLGDTNGGAKLPYSATIYTAYFTLIVCVWRTLHRTTADALSQSTTESLVPAAQMPGVDFLTGSNLNWEFDDIPEMGFRSGRGESRAALSNDLHDASFNCVSTFVGFVLNMSPGSFSEFWHSWSSSCFVLVSNFLILLLIQAPDQLRATKVNALVVAWRRAIDWRYKGFPHLTLAKACLGSYFRTALEDTFQIQRHTA